MQALTSLSCIFTSAPFSREAFTPCISPFLTAASSASFLLKEKKKIIKLIFLFLRYKMGLCATNVILTLSQKEAMLHYHKTFLNSYNIVMNVDLL